MERGNRLGRRLCKFLIDAPRTLLFPVTANLSLPASNRNLIRPSSLVRLSDQSIRVDMLEIGIKDRRHTRRGLRESPKRSPSGMSSPHQLAQGLQSLCNFHYIFDLLFKIKFTGERF